MTKLNKTAKLEYFNNLKLGKDNKPFWEKCQPYYAKWEWGITFER